MQTITAYCAFVGTAISILGWSLLVRRHHDRLNPTTPSKLAAARKHTLWYFRFMLWICTPLFFISVWFYLVPRYTHQSFHKLALGLTLVGGLLLAVFPATPHSKSIKAHNLFAAAMGLGVYLLTLLYAIVLPKPYRYAEFVLACVLLMLGVVSGFRMRSFIFYELAFIWFSHSSILVALYAST